MDEDNKLDWDAALVMGLVYTVIYGVMIAMILFVEIPVANQKTVDILAGAMTIIQTTIVTYFFGMTRSAERSQRLSAESKEKTDTAMREIVSGAVPAAAAPLKADDVKIEAAGSVSIEGKKEGEPHQP